MQAVVQLNAPPGTPVFKLQARDPDTDHNIHYFLIRDRSESFIRLFCNYSVFFNRFFVIQQPAEDLKSMKQVVK
jgi:hypothetical protein